MIVPQSLQKVCAGFEKKAFSAFFSSNISTDFSGGGGAIETFLFMSYLIFTVINNNIIDCNYFNAIFQFSFFFKLLS